MMIHAIVLAGTTAAVALFGSHDDLRPIERRPPGAASDTALARSAGAVIPFEYEDARVYVPVEVGGQVHWFILDTGAQSTVIDEGLATALGMCGHDTSVTTGAGSGAMRQARGDDIAIRAGGRTLTLRQPPIAPIDALLSRYTGRHAPGILGSRFFTDVAVTLDFDEHVVTVRDSVERDDTIGAVSVPLEIDGGIPYVRATLRFAGHAAVSAKLLVDLGAKSTLLLAEPFIELAGLGDLQSSGVRSSLGAGVGGETRYSFVRLDRLDVGPDPRAHLDSAVVGLSIGGTIRQRAFDGLLGAEFLRRYHVTFDYRGRRMLLRPRRPALPTPGFDMSGIFVTASGPSLRAFTVANVAPGSAAANGGIRAGDRIASIGGRDAGAMTLSDVRAALLGPVNARVALVLVRAGERTEAVITLAKRV